MAGSRRRPVQNQTTHGLGFDRHPDALYDCFNGTIIPQLAPMKFAHFSHIWAKPGMTPHQRYEQLWRELQLCDELGFDHSFCVEHHFRPDESWMSSPSLYAVGAGARTKRLRIGPMGYIVPLYHPLRLAEEIAIVDQMLGGRMELGLVPGINPDYFRPFGLDYGQRKSPTLEFVDYLRAAFGETPAVLVSWP